MMKNYNEFQTVPNVFTEDECDQIIAQCKEQEMVPGPIYDGTKQVVMEGVRKAENWVFPDIHPDYAWIRQRLHSASREINSNWFEFDIVGNRPDRIAFVVYPTGGFFHPHVDNLGSEELGFKKLSCVVQLSDPDSYMGGDLSCSLTNKVPPRDRGTMIAFPSYVRHCVSEVESGERCILVNWCVSDTHFK